MRPVCGSDLRIYSSLCAMKMEACQRQQELRLRPLDLCQGSELSRKIARTDGTLTIDFLSLFLRFLLTNLNFNSVDVATASILRTRSRDSENLFAHTMTFAQAWKSSRATATLHWWTPRARSTTAVADQNAETAPATPIATRPRDSHAAARKVSGKERLSVRCLISNVSLYNCQLFTRPSMLY